MGKFNPHAKLRYKSRRNLSKIVKDVASKYQVKTALESWGRIMDRGNYLLEKAKRRPPLRGGKSSGTKSNTSLTKSDIDRLDRAARQFIPRPPSIPTPKAPRMKKPRIPNSVALRINRGTGVSRSSSTFKRNRSGFTFRPGDKSNSGELSYRHRAGTSKGDVSRNPVRRNIQRRFREIQSDSGFYSVETMQVSNENGWALLSRFYQDDRLLYGVSDGISVAQKVVAEQAANELKRAISDPGAFPPLSSITKRIDEARGRLRGQGYLRPHLPSMSSPGKALSRVRLPRNRGPWHRTGSLASSIVVQEMNQGGQKSYFVGFPNTPHKGQTGNGNMTNASLARLLESGYTMRIPPSAKQMEWASQQFGGEGATEDGPQRKLLNLIGIIDSLQGGKFLFPNRWGRTITVPPRPLRQAVVTNMQRVDNPDRNKASKVMSDGMWDAMVHQTPLASAAIKSPQMNDGMSKATRSVNRAIASHQVIKPSSPPSRLVKTSIPGLFLPEDVIKPSKNKYKHWSQLKDGPKKQIRRWTEAYTDTVREMRSSNLSMLEKFDFWKTAARTALAKMLGNDYAAYAKLFSTRPAAISRTINYKPLIDYRK